MAGINKAIVVGNLGIDPELRHTQSGAAVCNLRVATAESWTDKSGEKQERTEWHNVVCFARLAEIAGEYLRKGSKVYIEGSLRTSSWEQDGQTRYRTEIIAREMQMLDSRGQGGGGNYDMPPPQGGMQGGAPSQGGMSQGGPPQGGMRSSGGGQGFGGGRPQSGSAPAPAPEPDLDDFDDDIPF